jgi:hypothetical protein
MKKQDIKSYIINFVLGLFGISVIVVIIYFIFIKTESFESKPVITFYYMDGCGWCEKAKPEWQKCKSRANSENFEAREVSAKDLTSKEMKALGIDGFPTFTINVNGTETLYPSGEDRTSDALISYMKNLM